MLFQLCLLKASAQSQTKAFWLINFWELIAAIVRNGTQITIPWMIRVKNTVDIISNEVMAFGKAKGRTQRVPCEHESTSECCGQMFRNSL